ncbi:hypothetical protein SAMN05444287_0907 [Octadecabacter temperatus]|uniref:Uncharacterized protein n=1 Tax=Octadecabacter temperatus TaxID=1458307 RepID=A0A0K0Y497_9RHOB|nr:hypothetical protein [Octadecabacter temperatus]AKS45808.1 hypothetical protein OSB_12530 [Octadecabacter temperatus]SIO00997.1 hypothetical protein SAMN05444287_0907 [Octadecabacter temperatus]
MFISIDDYENAAGVCRITPTRRFKRGGITPSHLAPTPSPKSIAPAYRRRYLLAEAVTTLAPSEVAAGAIEKLFAAATIAPDSMYAGGIEATPTARRLIDWLPDEAMQDRWAQVQSAFFVAVANSKLCVPAVVGNLNELKDLAILQPHVLAHVICNAPRPAMLAMSPAFIIANNEES